MGHDAAGLIGGSVGLFRRPIRAKGPDRFLVDLPEELREVLSDVCGEVLGLLDGDDVTSQPVLERVFPPASVEDEEVRAGYRDLVQADLVRSRRDDLGRIVATVHDREMDRATIEAWMTGCNTLRLVLGTRLDVREDELPELAADDPELPVWALYEFLGALVGWIVEALDRTA